MSNERFFQFMMIAVMLMLGFYIMSCQGESITELEQRVLMLEHAVTGKSLVAKP